MTPGGVVEAFDEVEHAMRASVCERKRWRSISSHSSVAKKLSHITIVGVADRTGGGPHPGLSATIAKGERRVLRSFYPNGG